MRLLIDTHIAIWAITDDVRLTEEARKIMLDPETIVYLSAVSVWEVDMKVKSRKSNLDFTTDEFVKICSKDSGYILAPMRAEHIIAANHLVWKGEGDDHRDPWDRILLAQAMTEGFKFMTHDEKIAKFKQDCVIRV